MNCLSIRQFTWNVIYFISKKKKKKKIIVKISPAVMIDALRVKIFLHFYNPPCNSGGILWYHVGCLCVCLIIHLSYVHLYFCLRTITWVNVNGFSTNLVCALILWRSGFELLMGKFCQFLSCLSLTWQWQGIIISPFYFDNSHMKCKAFFSLKNEKENSRQFISKWSLIFTEKKETKHFRMSSATVFLCSSINFYHPLGIFSRWQIDNIFLIFQWK